MDYIYRYIDNNDQQVKYIGRSKRKLDCRVNEHENLDQWVNHGNWRIEYFKVPNQSYSEALESHLIAFYQTYKWYNIAKKNWGIIQEFLSYQFHWKLYSDNGMIINLPYDYLPILEDKSFGNNQTLITDKEMSYETGISIDDVWKAAKKNVIQPLAQTEQEELLFIEEDIEKLFDYYRTYQDIEIEK